MTIVTEIPWYEERLLLGAGLVALIVACFGVAPNSMLTDSLQQFENFVRIVAMYFVFGTALAFCPLQPYDDPGE